MASNDKKFDKILARSDVRACETKLLKAIKMHTVYEIPRAQLARYFNISQSSIRRGERAIESGRPVSSNGRPRIFSSKEEEEIVNKIREEADQKTPLSRLNSKEFAESILLRRNLASEELSPENSPSSQRSTTVSLGWVDSFVARTNRLKAGKSLPLELDKAKFAAPKSLGAFFDCVEGLFEEHHYVKEMIANFDETMLNYDQKKITVVKRSHTSRKHALEPSSTMHITLGITIFADGTHPRHMVITPAKTIPQHINLDDFPEFVWGEQEGAWIDKELLESYIIDQVIPHFQQQRKKINNPNARGLLLINGHPNRYNLNLLDILAKEMIDVQTLVSHCSHILQPLDLGCFGVFKKHLNSARSEINMPSPNQAIEALLISASIALSPAMNHWCIRESFEKAGIVPLDRRRVMKHSGIGPSPPKNSTQPLLEEEEDEEESTQSNSKKRKRIPKSGRTLIGQDFQEDELKAADREA